MTRFKKKAFVFVIFQILSCLNSFGACEVWQLSVSKVVSSSTEKITIFTVLHGEKQPVPTPGLNGYECFVSLTKEDALIKEDVPIDQAVIWCQTLQGKSEYRFDSIADCSPGPKLPRNSSANLAVSEKKRDGGFISYGFNLFAAPAVVPGSKSLKKEK